MSNSGGAVPKQPETLPRTSAAFAAGMAPTRPNDGDWRRPFPLLLALAVLIASMSHARAGEEGDTAAAAGEAEVEALPITGDGLRAEDQASLAPAPAPRFATTCALDQCGGGAAAAAAMQHPTWAVPAKPGREKRSAAFTRLKVRRCRLTLSNPR